ncbi:hypothetical protein JW992_02010 [candidate division KSB1 bacterium]|nr:hypothetical protein [candidate division KSB1 bacterium]
MKQAILLTHGPLGEALIQAVAGIMGVSDGLHALSVTDMSVAEITQRLLSLVNAPDGKQDGVLIMASLKGGSCWNVSIAVAGQNPSVRVVSGVNLSMVLSFMTKRDEADIDVLVDIVAQDGIRGITRFIPHTVAR